MNSERRNPRRLDPLDVLVGKRIRTQRLVRKMSQSDLGRQLGITFQQIQKYESGVNRVGAGRLQQIAKIFELPVNVFFGEDTATQDASEATNEAVLNFLNTARAVKLVKDFARVKDPALQQAIVTLVEKIANA
ncbi:MAG: helix-turn-helix transcriptional regulator [Pseudolabrys sp.]|nr:helix-turn-helix transcriptional regulator [Pseudolabrys sp.]MDP2296932.1 helix-turn-helix transcriptional regulator [Pseudolabrys sp.]